MEATTSKRQRRHPPNPRVRDAEPVRDLPAVRCRGGGAAGDPIDLTSGGYGYSKEQHTIDLTADEEPEPEGQAPARGESAGGDRRRVPAAPGATDVAHCCARSCALSGDGRKGVGGRL